MTGLDNFYLHQQEPNRGCFLALREIILAHDSEITHDWKYNMPFFSYQGKMFCYLWTHKKQGIPFIGFVEGKRFNHPDLIFEGRARIKIMLMDPNADLPLETIQSILTQALGFYKSGLIKTKKEKVNKTSEVVTNRIVIQSNQIKTDATINYA